MAIVVWTRMRLRRIENKVLTDVLNVPIQEEDAAATVYLWRSEVVIMVGIMYLLTDDFLKEIDIVLEHALRFQKKDFGEEEICKLAIPIPELDMMLN